jgi:hypothetical protein
MFSYQLKGFSFEILESYRFEVSQVAGSSYKVLHIFVFSIFSICF